VSYVEVQEDTPDVVLYWTCDDLATAYVNGVEVGRYTSGRAVAPDSDISAAFTLKKGINVIMVKVVNYYLEWGAGVRLIDKDHRPLAGLPIVAAPQGKVAPDDFGWEMTCDTDFGITPPTPTSLQVVLPSIRFRPQSDKTATFTTDACCFLRSIQVREAATGTVAYTLSGDALGVPVNTGYRCTRTLTFTNFMTPGMYYLYNPDYQISSPAFVIL
jgi:hypothetical protein